MSLIVMEHKMLELDSILDKAQKEIAAVTSIRDLESIRVNYIGKKGIFTEQMKSLGKLPKEERPAFGQKVNS